MTGRVEQPLRRRPYAFIIGTLMLVLAATSLLSAGWRAQDAGSSSTRSIVDGVFTADQALRGQQQFQRACLSCHAVREHAGRNFAVRWEGLTLGDLFELVSTTMPESEPGSLEPEEYASILAFFLKESGYKEGAEDLPSDAEALKKIRIEPLPK